MRKSTRFVCGLAMAGIVAAGGSAFTASSSIDYGSKHVGSVGQTTSGVTVTNVEYTVAPDTDTVTGVKFHVTESLDTWDKVTAKISDGATTPATDSATCTKVVASGTQLTCIFDNGGVAHVTKLDIIAS